MRTILFFIGVLLLNGSVKGQQIYPTSYFVRETLIHFYSYAFKGDSFHIVLRDSTTTTIELPDLYTPILILSKPDAFQKILETKNESFHTEDVQLNYIGNDTVDVRVIPRFTETLLIRVKRKGKIIKENHVTYPIICFDVDDRFSPICRFIYNSEKGEWVMIKLRPKPRTSG